jgi:hypothetical protein
VENLRQIYNLGDKWKTALARDETMLIGQDKINEDPHALMVALLRSPLQLVHKSPSPSTPSYALCSRFLSGKKLSNPSTSS